MIIYIMYATTTWRWCSGASCALRQPTSESVWICIATLNSGPAAAGKTGLARAAEGGGIALLRTLPDRQLVAARWKKISLTV